MGRRYVGVLCTSFKVLLFEFSQLQISQGLVRRMHLSLAIEMQRAAARHCVSKMLILRGSFGMENIS